MTNYREILRLDSIGLNKTEIAASCGCSRNTVSSALKRAEECELNWPLPADMSDEATVLHLIRSFLRAGAMEDGLVSPTEEGVPQSGPLSPVLSNIYLDKLDKELEGRGLRFVRYADDCDIFVRSEKAADRVMASVTGWLERKLRLKVSASKTKVVRPTNSTFLGFNFWKSTEGWKPRPAKDRKAKLCEKVKTVLCRKRAAAVPLWFTFVKLNQILRGWINYYFGK